MKDNIAGRDMERVVVLRILEELYRSRILLKAVLVTSCWTPTDKDFVTRGIVGNNNKSL